MSDKKFSDVLDNVPDYKTFYTVDELNDSSEKLAAEHPDKVSLFEIGRSKRGETIKALRIGDGKLNALLFGFPHPNEPIGSMMLEYLSRRLVEDDALREELDFTWYLVKCADPDGARLNEGWFKGPFTPLNYALNFYRPPGYLQIEWTFPIEYKTLKWDKPVPETKALMNLMNKVKFDFMYSLHNSGFGGVYFYVSDRCPPLYPIFQKLARDEDLPLHLGEPEVPWAEKLADAIFLMPTSKEAYEFYKEHTGKDPATIINYGTSSDDYARSVNPEVFTLVCEMPYYYDPRIEDTSNSDIKRRTAFLHGLDISEGIYNFIKEKYGKAKSHLTVSSPFTIAIEDYLKHFPDNLAAERHWAETSPKVERLATVAEKFDSYVVRKVYGLLLLGELVRLLDYELTHGKKNPELEKLKDEVKQEVHSRNQELEGELNYYVIPIRKLVKVQLGSALYTANYIKEKRSNL